MLICNKDSLKQLIFNNLFARIKLTFNDNDSDFKFEFDENQENIIFTCATKSIYGASCWGRKHKEKELDLNYFDESEIKECLSTILIKMNELSNYQIILKTKKKEDLEDYLLFYDNIHPFEQFFFDTEEDDSDHDYYGNHNKLRTIKIPVEEIAIFLLSFKFTKPLVEYEVLFEFINFEEDNNSLIIINKELLENTLELRDNNFTKIKL